MEKNNTNVKYNKSLSLAWAELAIKDYRLMFDTPFANEYLMSLLSLGQIVYSEFSEEFEEIWLRYFTDLSTIPSEITEKVFCAKSLDKSENL